MNIEGKENCSVQRRSMTRKQESFLLQNSKFDILFFVLSEVGTELNHPL